MQKKPPKESISNLIKVSNTQENTDMIHVNFVTNLPHEYYVAIKTIALKEKMKLKDLIAGIIIKFVEDYKNNNSGDTLLWKL